MATSRRCDRAISPVIGALMMVGMTVILAGAVYLWTSSYAEVPEQHVRIMGLAGLEMSDGEVKTYAVSAAMRGLRHGDFRILVDETALHLATRAGCPDPQPDEVVVCRDGATLGPAADVRAGDLVKVPAPPGARVSVVDHASGATVYAMVVS